MLLRRAMAHAKAQNWFAVAVDFLIVMIGVFMGLQAQEWNQRRTDRLDEQNYLARMLSDFAAIDEQLQRCLSVYKDSIEAIKAVSEGVNARDQASASGDQSLAAALLRMTAGEIPAGRSATFVEMVSTGDLGILRDEDLRNALVAYDQHAEINRENWRSLQDIANAYERPLYKNVDLHVDLDAENFSSIRRYDLAAMANDPGFGTMLNVLTGTKANNYELCQRQLALSDAVRRKIENNRR